MSVLRSAAQLISIVIIFSAVLVSAQVRAAAPDHPCHPGSPGGPGIGPPCPPTPVPEVTSEGEDSADVKGAFVRFDITNSTGERITVWLGAPVSYVFNVDAGATQTFIVPRDVYSYELISCGVLSSGYLNLMLHSYLQVDPCRTVKLVRVDLVNVSDRPIVVLLSGVADYVLPIQPGVSRAVTIERGAYLAEIIGCGDSYTTTLSPHSGEQVELRCP